MAAHVPGVQLSIGTPVKYDPELNFWRLNKATDRTYRKRPVSGSDEMPYPFLGLKAWYRLAARVRIGQM